MVTERGPTSSPASRLPRGDGEHFGPSPGATVLRGEQGDGSVRVLASPGAPVHAVCTGSVRVTDTGVVLEGADGHRWTYELLDVTAAAVGAQLDTGAILAHVAEGVGGTGFDLRVTDRQGTPLDAWELLLGTPDPNELGYSDVGTGTDVDPETTAARPLRPSSTTVVPGAPHAAHAADATRATASPARPEAARNSAPPPDPIATGPAQPASSGGVDPLPDAGTTDGATPDGGTTERATTDADSATGTGHAPPPDEPVGGNANTTASADDAALLDEPTAGREDAATTAAVAAMHAHSPTVDDAATHTDTPTSDAGDGRPESDDTADTEVDQPADTGHHDPGRAEEGPDHEPDEETRREQERRREAARRLIARMPRPDERGPS